MNIEIPERKPLSPAAKRLLQAIESSVIAALTKGRLCLCEACVDKRVTDVIAGYAGMVIAVRGMSEADKVKLPESIMAVIDEVPHRVMQAAQNRAGGKCAHN